MKKHLLIIIAYLTCIVGLYGRPLVEAKAGYFFFTGDPTMRQVFYKGGLDIQLSGSYPVYDILHIYGSVEYLERSGQSLGDRQKTSIWMTPLSLGLQPVFKINSHSEYYFAFGPRFFVAHVHNRSTYVPSHMKSTGLGGFANTGFLLRISKHAKIDLFGEYSYKKLKFHSHKQRAYGHTVQVSGLTFGGGIGYSF